MESLRLNSPVICPAKACGFQVNPFVVKKMDKDHLSTVVECPVCGETWEIIHRAYVFQRVEDPGD